MATAPWVNIQLNDCSGGENRLTAPELVQQNQLLVALNCIITPEGLPQTRKGLTKVTNDTSKFAGAPTSIHRFAKENGDKFLVVQYDTALYYKSWNGTASITTAFTSVKTGLTAGSVLRSVIWRDNLILTNGTENPFRFDGSACTDLAGSPPKSRYIAVYGGKLWLVDVANINQIRFSGLEDYGVWDALDVIKVRSGDGDLITGLSSQNGGLIITKQESVWVLQGTSRTDITLSTAPLFDGAGCVAPRTLLDQGFFLGRLGFYHFNLSQVIPIAQTHESILYTMSETNKSVSFAAYQPKDKYIILVLGDGTILAISPQNGAVTTWYFPSSAALPNPVAMCACDIQGDDGILVIAADNGHIYRLSNENNDDGENIYTYIWTPYRDFGIVRKKVFRQFQPEIMPVTGISHNITLYADVDNQRLVDNASFAQIINNVMTFNVDDWNEAYWGYVGRSNNSLWLHGMRGDRASFGIRAYDRIKLLGYHVKFREAGAI